MEKEDIRITLSYDLFRFSHNPDRYAIETLKSARHSLDTLSLSADGFASRAIRENYERQIDRALSSLNRAISVLEKEDRYDRTDKYKSRKQYKPETEPTVVGLRLEDINDEYIGRTLSLIEEATEKFGTEIWLGPFLKNEMNIEFEEFDNPSRKVIISEMQRRGLVRIEERPGSNEGESFSVLIPVPEEIQKYELSLDEKNIATNENPV